jgi:hypothetical protein
MKSFLGLFVCSLFSVLAHGQVLHKFECITFNTDQEIEKMNIYASSSSLIEKDLFVSVEIFKQEDSVSGPDHYYPVLEGVINWQESEGVLSLDSGLINWNIPKIAKTFRLGFNDRIGTYMVENDTMDFECARVSDLEEIEEGPY